MILPIYVPVANTPHAKLIDRGSAIVGIPEKTSVLGVLVYFEGNRFKAGNIKTFADKCVHAAGRGIANYPTVAKAYIARNMLILVGGYEVESQTVSICGMSEWLDWCDRVELDPKELRTSS